MNESGLSEYRRRTVSVIYQFYNLLPMLNVKANITLPLELDGKLPDGKRLDEILRFLGLEEKRFHYPDQLSGGQQQRVAIARSLMTSPKLLLADEPTGNLDSRNSAEIISLLKKSNHKLKQTILLVTHDMSIAEQADRVICISDGKVTEAKYAAYVLSDDGLSISLTLASANVRELSNMTSFRVMPKHIYEGKDSVTEAEARVTCGPYMLDSFNKEAGTLTFIPNPYYPLEPNVGKLTYRLFGNEDTMYLALQNGDLDMTWGYSTGVSGSYQDVLAATDTLTLEVVTAANAPAVLALNNANGLFADENLRLAVSYALDYDTFRTVFGSAYASNPNRGFVPPVTVGYKETEALGQDLTKAAQCMADAGYTEKNADGFYVNADGETCAFTLTCNAGKEAHVGYAELVKTQLEQFGIQVDLETLDADSYNAKTSNKFSENNITMEAAIYGYTAAGMGMKNGLASIYVDGTHPVQGGCQVFDEEFQAILSAMGEAKTVEEYTNAAGSLQDWYAAHTPLIALYWDSQILVHSAAYENFTVDAVFGLNNANTWFSITAK